MTAGALALTLLVSACGTSSEDGPAAPSGSSAAEAQVSVVASTNVYGDIVKQIAGDSVSITSIISDPGADPHSYEANTRTQLELSRADVVIENGGGYDDFVDTMLKSAGNSATTVLNAVDISGKKAEPGEELNEHVWYDFPSMGLLADQVATALSAADPSNASVFGANAAAFKQKLEQLEATEASIKAAHSGAGVAITEPVPVYLLEACGLVNKTPEEFSEAIEEGTDVPAAVLRETTQLVTGGQVALLAYNAQTSGPQTQQVLDAAKNANLPVVAVTETLPDGKDYVTWMTGNLAGIRAALG